MRSDIIKQIDAIVDKTLTDNKADWTEFDRNFLMQMHDREKFLLMLYSEGTHLVPLSDAHVSWDDLRFARAFSLPANNNNMTFLSYNGKELSIITKEASDALLDDAVRRLPRRYVKYCSEIDAREDLEEMTREACLSLSDWKKSRESTKNQ